MQLAYSVEDARRQLGGISRSKFYKMVEAGELRAVKIGGRTVVADVELRRVLSAAADAPSQGAVAAA